MRRLIVLCAMVLLPMQAWAAGSVLLQWGWGEPGPQFMAEHAAEMDQLPFDGFIFHLDTDKHENFSWLNFGPRQFELSEFETVRTQLQQAHFVHLRERFLRVNATPGSVDWFDDAGWSAIVHNAGIAATLARESGAKGLVLDIEEYEGQVFDYRKRPGKNEIPLDRYEAKAFERGQQWISAVAAAFPDAVIFLPHAYTVGGPKGPKRAESYYGLAPMFMDGMLSRSGTGMRFVDGGERAYKFKSEAEFIAARRETLETNRDFSSVPKIYQAKMQTAFGIWMDADWGKRGWLPAMGWFNYFSPDDLARSLHFAFAHSDRYVWIYSEKALWWTNQNLSDAYIQAVRDAHP